MQTTGRRMYKSFIISIFLPLLLATKVRIADAAADPCADFINQFSGSASPAGKPLLHFYTGFMNGALAVTETNKIYFGSAPYMSLNAHLSIAKAIEEAAGSPIRWFLFLGELHRSQDGFDQGNEVSGFSQTIPKERNRSSVFHFQTVMDQRSDIMAPDFQGFPFVKGRSDMHLNKRLNSLNLGNVRHDALNDLNFVTLAIDTILKTADGSLIAHYQPEFRRNRRALLAFLRLFASAQREPPLVRIVRRDMARLAGRAPLLSLGDLERMSRRLRTFLQVLREPPVILQPLGEWDEALLDDT